MTPEIRAIPIADLKPAPYNPRKDLKPGDAEYEKIKQSITAFGFIEPLVWNERTGNVVGGHQRLKVLIEQGVKSVPCVVVDFDEDTERAANLALNKIGGDWDFSKLADVLLELEHANFDLDLTGFDAGEIKNIMGWTANQQASTLAEKEATSAQVKQAAQLAAETAAKVTSTLEQVAAIAPARLSEAAAIVFAKTGTTPLLILDNTLTDLITEIERYDAAGEPNPLAALLACRYPMTNAAST